MPAWGCGEEVEAAVGGGAGSDAGPSSCVSSWVCAMPCGLVRKVSGRYPDSYFPPLAYMPPYGYAIVTVDL